MNLSKLFKPFLVSAALTIGLAGCGANQSDIKRGKSSFKTENN